jgi:hypothetical protein
MPFMRASATSVIPPSFDELVEEAEIIFEGRLTASESKWVGENETRRIQTDHVFQVTESLKGSVPSIYTLQVLGGTVGDTTLEVEGAPQFTKGERVILFVTQNGVQFIPLVGIMHGHYRIKRGPATNQDTLVMHDGTPLQSVEEIGKDKAASGGRLGRLRAQSAQGAAASLTPEAFKNLIRAKK